MRHIVLSFLLAALLCIQTGCAAPTSDAAAPAPAKDTQAPQLYTALHPDNKQGKLEKEIVAKLQASHYNKIKLDNDFSKKLFDAYLDDLDPTHSVFLASDVNHLRQQYAHELTQQLTQGKLSAAFDIFNTFQKRRIEIDEWVLARIKQGLGSLEMHDGDSLATDREDAPWPADEAARERLWTQQLENQVVELKLNDIDSEEIQKRLTQRYSNSLDRLKQTDPGDVFDIFMDAFTHSYDPHTDYFSPTRLENFNIDMNLQLQGIGAELRSKNGYAEIVRLIPGGPAAKSGKLKPTDRIIAVGQGKHGDFTDVIGMRLDQTVRLIRGKAGSIVRLQISPDDNGQTRTVTLTRAKIKLKDQEASSRIITVEQDGQSHKIGLIILPSFYNGTSRDVEAQIKKLKKQKVEGIILDLRNNGGGALDEAVETIGLFMKSGPAVQIRDADGNIQVLGYRNDKAIYSGPLAVLTNRLSASASEIVAGALQDYGRALVLGSQTFGKGTVQTMLPLSSSSGQLKLTEAKFYRITGKSTQDRGVKPDIDFPSAIDPKKIGESALPNALPYDTIPPTIYPISTRIEKSLPTLKREHDKRTRDDADYQYLVKRIDLTRKQSDKKSVPLDIDTRRSEQSKLKQKILDLANANRRAHGEEPYADYKAFKKDQSDKEAAAQSEKDSGAVDETLPTLQPNQAGHDKTDAYQTESAHILLDLIQLLHGHGHTLKQAA